MTGTSSPTRSAVESDGGLGFDPELASFGARAIGLLIDSVIVAVLMVPGVVVAAVVQPLLGGALAVAGFVAATAWYARDVATTGRWFGGRAMSLHVVDVRNGRMVDCPHAATRFVLRQLISPILLFGFVMALVNPQRRAFHDQAAGTIVTRPKLERWELDADAAAAGSSSARDR